MLSIFAIFAAQAWERARGVVILGLQATGSWTTPTSKGKKGLDQPVWGRLELVLHSIVCLSLRGGIDAPGSRDNLSTPSLTMRTVGGGGRVFQLYESACRLLLGQLLVDCPAPRPS